MKLKKWADVYPQGTPEGDEEYKFFINLARNPKYVWRSTAGLANDSGLSKARVEKIIEKYAKMGMVYQHPKNDDNWGYWERVPKDLLPQDHENLVDKDQKARMKKHSSK